MSLTLTDVSGVGPSTAENLKANKINSVKKLATSNLSKIVSIPGIGETTGQAMIDAANTLLAETAAAGGDSATKSNKDKKGKKDKKRKKKDKKDKKGKKKDKKKKSKK